MSEVALFYHFYEIENRDNFDPNVSISPKNFKKLLGEYKFDEDAICQVHREKGHCGHKHKSGWLGLTDDYKEVLIGGHCAKKYFKADSSFNEERRRIKKELNIKRYTDSINKIINNKSDFESSVNDSYKKAKALKVLSENLEKELHPAILVFLKNCEKTANRKIDIEVQYVEVDENNNKHVDWVRQTLGNVKRASFVEYKNIGDLFKRIKIIKETLMVVSGGLEVNELKLKKWNDALYSYVSVDSDVEMLLAEYHSFIEKSNLDLLCFVTPTQSIQYQHAELVLKFYANENMSPQKYVRELDFSVRNRFGNRNFRVAR